MVWSLSYKMKKTIILSITILLFLSCEKELSINDFSDDFSFYEPELRIEAIIYPTDSTAIVRIDQSIRIDEARGGVSKHFSRGYS